MKKFIRWLFNIKYNKDGKCAECGAYIGHAPECSLMDETCAKKMLKEYYHTWLTMETKHRKRCVELGNQIRMANHQTNLWVGKFSIVKHENNKLRKELYKRNRPSTLTHEPNEPSKPCPCGNPDNDCDDLFYGQKSVVEPSKERKEAVEFLTCVDCGKSDKTVCDRGLFNGIQCYECKKDQDIEDVECR